MIELLLVEAGSIFSVICWLYFVCFFSAICVDRLSRLVGFDRSFFVLSSGVAGVLSCCCWVLIRVGVESSR